MPVAWTMIFRSLVLLMATTTASAVSSPSNLAEHVRSSITATLDQLQETGDFAKAERTLQAQFDRVIAFADTDDKALFRDAAFSLRFVRQLGTSDQSIRLDLFAYLRENHNLATTLAFLIKSDKEEPSEVYALLDRLRRHRGESPGPLSPVMHGQSGP